jgi:hypothetical protein
LCKLFVQAAVRWDALLIPPGGVAHRLCASPSSAAVVVVVVVVTLEVALCQTASLVRARGAGDEISCALRAVRAREAEQARDRQLLADARNQKHAAEEKARQAKIKKEMKRLKETDTRH